MGLAEDLEKSNFDRTAVPLGRASRRRRDQLAFVVQQHDATRLHYDLRLELDGVLKSWAVPKGPSLDPADKRLAIEVEDHPLDYADFEGVIAAGQYGGGSVLLWDRGTWEPDGDARTGLAGGKLTLTLHGEKLRGRWLLVRTGVRRGKTEWLLRKLADQAASATGGEITRTRPESVLSGRTLAQIGQPTLRLRRRRHTATASRATAGLPGARRARLPRFVEPQLATLVAQPPAGAEWLHEAKLDGYRLLCRLDGGKARLLTRRGLDWTDTFGRIAAAAATLPARTALLDGEVAWLREDGRSDFQALQQALGGGRDQRLVYLVFDLLHLEGHDLTRAPLRARKEALATLLAGAPPEAAALRFSDHVEGDGDRFFAEACRLGLEGIVSKRAAAPYRSGRGSDWRKVKCVCDQELVIVGFSEPAGTRSDLGALLLGAYEGDRLRYAGKVGTGFDAATLRRLRRLLAPLERRDPPLTDPPRGHRARGVHWVEPRLVAQVAFTGWTGDGRLRHPSFRGLREDKEARAVVRELPGSDATGRPPRPRAAAARHRTPTAAAAARGARPAGAERRAKPRARAPARPGRQPKRQTEPGAQPASRPAAKKAAKAGSSGATTPGRASAPTLVAGVRISHPDRLVYPERGVTKVELARYYERIAERILPHLHGRPLSLLRCPAGRGEPCFYQKHLGAAAPPTLVEVAVTERSGEHANYVAVESAAGLVSLIQLGVLEIHPWGARRQDLERPDQLIFDLDPGPGVSWSEVVAAARALRDLLAELSLRSFPKLTGGKGLHLVVPIVPELPWDSAKAFCRAVAGLLARRAPERYTLQVAKSDRPGRIYLDYLRNGFGSTAIAPYSSRARPGAPVAAPVRWEELGRGAPDRYTVRNLARRLGALRTDPWPGFFTLRQRVPAAALEQLADG